MEYLFDAACAYDRRDTHADAGYSVFSRQKTGNREYGMLVSNDGFRDSFNRHGDSVVRCAFFFYNLICAVHDLFSDRKSVV